MAAWLSECIGMLYTSGGWTVWYVNRAFVRKYGYYRTLC